MVVVVGGLKVKNFRLHDHPDPRHGLEALLLLLILIPSSGSLSEIQCLHQEQILKGHLDSLYHAISDLKSQQ